MTQDPTQQLRNQLNDLLDDNLNQIPPSERGPFVETKELMRETAGDDPGRFFFFVADLSDPEEAFWVESLFDAPGFRGATDQATTWTENHELLYYACVNVSRTLYDELRKEEQEHEGADPSWWERLKERIASWWQRIRWS
jgi:hypothetical protein